MMVAKYALFLKRSYSFRQAAKGRFSLITLSSIFYLTLALYLLSLCPAVLADTVYHGTCKPDIRLKPMPNQRTKQGKVLWSGDGVFATRDRRIALIYTSKRCSDFYQGVNLIDKVSVTDSVRLLVSGGKSQEEAMDALYGREKTSIGFIHQLDDKTFTHEDGLGSMEVVSRVPPIYVTSSDCRDGVEIVNARKEIQKYVDQGLMNVKWSPK